jgi:hypothetical protein
MYITHMSVRQTCSYSLRIYVLYINLHSDSKCIKMSLDLDGVPKAQSSPNHFLARRRPSLSGQSGDSGPQSIINTYIMTTSYILLIRIDPDIN